MSGAPPMQSSPMPEPKPPPKGGGQERTQEKCRKTEIVRVYDETGKYWIDVEVLKGATTLGAQWKGPDQGNQSQETMLNLVRNLTADGACGHQMEVGMTPPTAEQKSAQYESKEKVVVPSRNTAVFDGRNAVRKHFKIMKDTDCCKGLQRRISFNEITKEYLLAEDPSKQQPSAPPSGGGGGGKEGERPPFGTGGPRPTPPPRSAIRLSNYNPSHLSAGPSLMSAVGPSTRADAPPVDKKYPPSKPEEYKKAVKASDDGSNLFLDICVEDEPDFRRGGQRQAVTAKNIWGKADIDMPGASKETDTQGPHLHLDPYQVPINFGPDSLAVEFEASDESKSGKGADGGGGGGGGGGGAGAGGGGGGGGPAFDPGQTP